MRKRRHFDWERWNPVRWFFNLDALPLLPPRFDVVNRLLTLLLAGGVGWWLLWLLWLITYMGRG